MSKTDDLVIENLNSITALENRILELEQIIKEQQDTIQNLNQELLMKE